MILIEGFFVGILLALVSFVKTGLFLILVTLLIVTTLFKWKMPLIKGAIGEWVVKYKLRRLGEEYTAFHDVYIPNGEGGITQVDHIVTSPYGMFVIETKNYEGWIFGDEYKPYWTQVIYRKKSKLYNPIRQNYGHVQALLSYIGQKAKVYSIIAFSTNSTFKFKKEFTSAHVIQFPALLKTIRQYSEPRMSKEEVTAINAQLNGLLVTDKNEKRQLKKDHMQSVRNAKATPQLKKRKPAVPVKVTESANSIAQTACSKCEGHLSLKKGRYGEFFGCSNYPKCRYTEAV